jgi:hypothetical protein
MPNTWGGIMATLSVGPGQQFQTISAAVAAAQNGDTLNVQAGTYTNDTASVTKSLAFHAVGGQVVLNETAAIPNDKGILVAGAGGADVNVSVDGFVFQNAHGPSGNDAGIRYEGGNLTLTNDVFRDNQNGILATPVHPGTGTISISGSEFAANGTGTGQTHNLYIGDVGSFSLTNSYVHDASVGHEVKSRAETSVITGNRILDNQGTSSYSIELPNGGNATITGNTIEQGPNGQNPNIIAYGAEGALHAGTEVRIDNNVVVNDQPGRGSFINNFTGTTLEASGNTITGLSPAQFSIGGPVTGTGNTFSGTPTPVPVSSSPALAASPTPTFLAPAATPAPAPAPAAPPTAPDSNTSATIDLSQTTPGTSTITLPTEVQLAAAAPPQAAVLPFSTTVTSPSTSGGSVADPTAQSNTITRDIVVTSSGPNAFASIDPSLLNFSVVSPA